MRALCKGAGCTIRKRMEFTEQEYLLEVLGPDAEAIFAAVEQLSQAAFVEWACPNTAFRPNLPVPAMPLDSARAGELRIAAGPDPNAPGVFPNDPYFPMQWHLHNTGQSGGTPGADIRAPEAWEITTGDPDIVVAVIDCGVDNKHPDLIDNLVAGYDFYDNDDQTDPAPGHLQNGHGTNCAGLIAAHANNAVGLCGVMWNCGILPVRNSSFLADGTWDFATEAESATGFRWAAVHGADVLSNSWGWRTSMPIVHSAIVDCTRADGIGRDGKGCIVLACTHNDNGVVRYPAMYPEVIAVGATDHSDVRCRYSNYGPALDVVGPSSWQSTAADWANSKGRGSLWTTDISGVVGWNFDIDPNILDYTSFGGTSGACAVAAGVAALILSIEPNLTGEEARHFLERSAKDLGDPGRDDYYGWGRVDARAALDMVLAKRADLNNDWKVDEADRVILVKAMEAKDRSADIAPAKKRDGVVDAKDLALLTQYMGTVIPEMGLIAHWKLDERTGGTAHDSAGKNNGTVIGNAGWQPEGGKIGGALLLSGVANFVMTGFVLNPANPPFSVFAWVKGGAPGQVILSQAGGVDWLLAQPGTGFLMSDLKVHPLLASVVSQTVITDGAWHRVGFVWDGANRILYADGVEAARGAQSALPDSTGGLYIGGGSIPAPGTLWNGLIDDVRIYNRAVKP